MKNRERMFIQDVEDLLEENDNEIVELYDNDGVLAYLEICPECGKYIKRLTDIELPYGLGKEEEEELLVMLPMEIADDLSEDEMDGDNMCTCAIFDDELNPNRP